MKTNELTNKELDSVKSIMNKLEREAYFQFKHFSGGFAKAEMYDYDEDFIDIELKFGVQSDCDSRVYTEEYKIDRATMEIIN